MTPQPCAQEELLSPEPCRLGEVCPHMLKTNELESVSTAAQELALPPVSILPFFHIKPNSLLCSTQTLTCLPALAPVADPDFTLTESHLCHHLTQLHRSRNKSSSDCEPSLLFDSISPAGFDFSRVFGNLTM